MAGGLIGFDVGTVDQSYATGSVHGDGGGLVGTGKGGISNSYATGAVSAGSYWGGGFAGFVGSEISSSYSTGTVRGDNLVGGFVGSDNSSSIADSYWDLDTSGITDPSQGAGNVQNDPGITGLSDAQLKSGLPSGFDKNIWAENPSINNGYPYLIANPPQ